MHTRHPKPLPDGWAMHGVSSVNILGKNDRVKRHPTVFSNHDFDGYNRLIGEYLHLFRRFGKQVSNCYINIFKIDNRTPPRVRMSLYKDLASANYNYRSTSQESHSPTPTPKPHHPPLTPEKNHILKTQQIIWHIILWCVWFRFISQ